MKNIQIIDGATNATFSVFQATAEEFDAIFPDGRDMELVEDLIDRLGEEVAQAVLTPLWDRPILKRDVAGIHGTLFYDNEDRRDHIPPSKREVDWDSGSVNQAQRDLFARHRQFVYTAKRASQEAGSGMSDTIDGVCCFCGKVVERNEHDPCELVIVTAKEVDQSWPCHSACFVDRMSDLPYIADGIFWQPDSN